MTEPDDPRDPETLAAIARISAKRAADPLYWPALAEATAARMKRERSPFFRFVAMEAHLGQACRRLRDALAAFDAEGDPLTETERVRLERKVLKVSATLGVIEGWEAWQ